MTRNGKLLLAVCVASVSTVGIAAWAADNSLVPVASGNETFANKDIGGVKFPKHILYDSAGAEVSPATSTQAGSLTETAPASDTASSGLNGRLQRIAQRLTSLIALLPTSLGAGGGLKVDGSGTALPVSGTVAVTGVATAANQATGNTSVGNLDTNTGTTSDAAVTAGATGSINAKLRAISRDIGTLTTLFNANGRATSANSSPTVQSPAPTTWHLISAIGTNATIVKASAATLFSCQLGNIDAAVAYLKIYNKASSPTVGTDTPVKTLIIPKAGTAADGAGSNISFGPGGLTLGTGFAAAVTAGITVADTTGVAASKVVINCDYE